MVKSRFVSPNGVLYFFLKYINVIYICKLFTENAWDVKAVRCDYKVFVRYIC